ncbi:MAG: bifunctional phosphopantothenoylcysteine decarboxylase/phosphopantothenate--cysteine ligase CoaBC [Thermoplasmata archaeon]
MHPSRAIRGARSELLTGRRILLGISGSIAAVEVPRIARELIRHGAEVQAVMSPEATRLITPEAIHFATGRPPITRLTGEVEHVRFLGPGEGRADLFLVAPATANTVSKIALGIDDTAVTSFASVALGGRVPMLIAPAMHQHMALNPAVRENLDRLRRWGVDLIAPRSTEGEEKLASPEEVAAAVIHRLATGPWVGRRVLVIGGAGREPIDRVRSVTNESSGEMAIALATQAHYLGAQVTLWLGAHSHPVPSFLAYRSWRRTEELLGLVEEDPGVPTDLSAVWVPAALADFLPVPSPGKISSRGAGDLNLTLRRAPKMLPLLRARAPAPTLLIGFKLEADLRPEELVARARELQVEHGLDFVVANESATLGAPTARVHLIGTSGPERPVEGTKMEVAANLLEAVGGALPERPAKAARSTEMPEGGTRSAVPRREGSEAR